LTAPRKSLDVVRLYFISPEVLVLLLSCAALIVFPKPMVFLGSEIVREGSVVQYVALLPAALLAVSFGLSKDSLRPLEGERNRVLYEWPDYWRLKFRALAALLFCLAASFGGLALWVFKTRLPSCLLGAGFIASIALALVSTVSLYLGYLRLREILQGGT
jgi:hypothetical protein